jgi:RNA polymerase sigma-70 factor, ECF subfamily
MKVVTPLGQQRHHQVRPEPMDDFSELYRKQLPYVLRTLRRLGVPRADLEDLLQEVFVVVSARIGSFDVARPIEPWLFGIAFRVVSNHRRHGKRRPAEVLCESLEESEAAAVGPEASAAEHEARALVLETLQALPLEQRAVFVMHDINEQSIPVVAEALDIPLNTTYSRLRAARSKFAAHVRRLRMARGER